MTDLIRMLVRHQWVREHGTPRLTVLVGDVATAAAVWRRWIELSGRTWGDGGTLCVIGDGAQAAELDRAIAAAIAEPRHPRAAAMTARSWDAWSGIDADRARAFAAEGVLVVAAAPEPEPGSATRPAPRRATPPRGGIDNARSLAELTLHEALEATPSTAGRFRMNQRVPFRFGGDDAEIDLLAREDAIAIEVDGYHHFGDPERYRRDRRKDALLQGHGLAVLRFLADDVLRDPRDAVQVVVELMANRLRDKGRR